MTHDNQPLIGIIGGAVAGSEAANLAASRGARVLVFEQNARPYGKIEDGLPRWHVKLRDKEFGRIDDNLGHPNITFVPKTTIGADLSWQALTRELGLSAVVLANGAWRDRPMPVEGIEALIGRGFAYQNPFVYWFNHAHEPGYEGPTFTIPDGALVIGGGLASIDVVKIMNYHLYKAALLARGVAFDAETYDKKGIPAICEAAGIDWRELGIKGPTLIYRRRPEDMPLVSAAPGDTSRAAKLAETRVRILEKAMEKFCVNFIPLASPLSVQTRPGPDGAPRLSAMTFQRNAMVDGKLRAAEGETFTVETELVVSSIGSIPAIIEGLPMDGELYRWKDWESGRLDDGDAVYGLGNVLTGKGNIVESRKNSRKVMDMLTRVTLGLSTDEEADAAVDAAHTLAREAIAPVVESALAGGRGADPAPALAWVAARHEALGYTDYASWIDAHHPLGHED